MTEQDRGFRLGVLFAAWHLHSGHGQDTYAEELIRHAGSVEEYQRLARKEDYRFRRGFWAELKRRQKRERAR